MVKSMSLFIHETWLLLLFQCWGVAISGSLPLLYGEVQSPGYPAPYPPSHNEIWDLFVPQGYILNLFFLHLDIEPSRNCYYDSLMVLYKKRILEVLCSQYYFSKADHPGNYSIMSPGNSLRLVFKTDSSSPGPHRYSGFSAIYRAVDIDECSVEADKGQACHHECHNTLGGFVCSCRYGYQLQPDNSTCQPVDCGVPVVPENRVSENPKTLYQDEIQLKCESNNGTQEKEVIYSCDAQGEWKPVNSSVYWTECAGAKTCPSTVTAHSSLIPEWSHYEYGKKVTVQCNTGFEAAMDFKGDMKTNYTSFCQRTGVWSPIHPCRRVDCGTPLLPESGVLQLVNKKPRTLYQDEIQLKCESKYYKLEGEDVYRCETQGEWRSKNGSGYWPVCVEVCGEPESKHSDFGRIFGGSEAEPGQIPWQVYTEDPRGAGTLISDRWVITAANVVEGQDSLLMYGGAVDIDHLGDSNYTVILESEKIFIHPGYPKAPTGGRRTSYDNDIALVRLKSRVPLGPHLLPICLPTRKDDGTLISERLGFVSGWGRTEHGTLSSKLLYVEIPVKDRATCSKRKDGKPVVQTFSENMFCAGEKDKDSCSGDSGGPFFLREFRRGPGGEIERGPFRLYGIVSWGIICHERGYYTKVDNYLDWITETIQREEKSKED